MLKTIKFIHLCIAGMSWGEGALFSKKKEKCNEGYQHPVTSGMLSYIFQLS